MAWFARSLTVAVLSLAAGSALAQTSRNACPAGQRPSLSGCVDGSSQAKVRLRPGAEPKATGPKPVPKPDPAVIVERAKPNPREMQSKVLLIRELAQLEAMLERTPEKSPDHLIVVRRLAEGYAELEAISERERARSQAAADELERQAKDAQKEKKTPVKRGTGTIL
jgi:hypothetical protein